METTLHLNQYWISICYFLFGIAAVAGGAVGGWLADWIGSPKSMFIVTGTFAVVLFILPYTTFSFILFLIVMMIWGMLSWALTPPIQNYIVDIDPVSSDIHQSINNSALQIGIALGSAIGGVVLEYTGSVVSTASVGAVIVLISIICVIVSLSVKSLTKYAKVSKS